MAGTGKHSDIRSPKWGFFSGIKINMNMTITPQNECDNISKELMN